MARRIRKNLRYLTLFGLLIILALLLINQANAQTDTKPYPTAPEPTSIALVSTGIIGWIIRFARKRFHEFKRVLDIIIAVIALIVVSPLILLTAAFIKFVSPGPAFYIQKRVGEGGMVFDIYKLRTMVVDAEKYTGAVWAQENDSRIIPFGFIIRKLRLDELPQLLNVLKGDMSIVGPRPERPELIANFEVAIPDYPKRLQVRPGITGLAQVHNRYDQNIRDVQKKVKYDLLYIKNMCFLTDLRILGRTVLVVLTGFGAR